MYKKHLYHAIKTLHIMFPPTSHSAPIFLTATLMQEVVTIHEKFLKMCLPVALAEFSHMGKANLPENAASAKLNHFCLP